jgi:hypothetical protein
MFDRNRAAIHLVFQAFDRWARKMPGQPVLCRAASYDLVGEKRVEIVHRVDLRVRGVGPGLAEYGHALFHPAEYEERLASELVSP